MIAALHNPDGSIAVKGFYDKVIPLTDGERAALAKVPYPEAEWLAETGAPHPWGEAGYTLRERIGGRPTLEVNGIWGGWMGEGSKTVLPAKVTAKISCRLVPNQDPLEVEELLRAHIKAITPPTVTSEVRRLSYGDGAMIPIDSPAMRVAEEAYERGFGKKPVFMREGGSIPVVATLQKIFGIPVIMAGYGLPDDGLHGPNEKLNLECFRRGIVTSIALFEGLGKLKS
jgi:acetylornithine deacetylase/succinyl-diaminopimelate desuccinylase-like protein